jgi:hypothetical protein
MKPSKDEAIETAQQFSIDRRAKAALISHFSRLVWRPVWVSPEQPVDETDLDHDEEAKGHADQPGCHARP